MNTLPTLRSRIEAAEWQAWLPGAAEVVLVTLLALQLARLVWLVVAPAGPIVEPATEATTAAVPSPSLPTVDVFFRRAAIASTATGEALGYRLFGVRSAPGEAGSAILGKDGEQASYAVGGDVAPGIVLASVGEEHAVLRANGASHRLDLPRLAATEQSGSAPAALPVGAPATPAPPQPAAMTAAQAAAPPATAARPPSPTGSLATPSDGYTITPSVRAALLRPAGLRPGDVVLSVNGRPLDPARLAGLQDELKGQAQLTIQYRRDGETHTTTVQAPR